MSSQISLIGLAGVFLGGPRGLSSIGEAWLGPEGMVDLFGVIGLGRLLGDGLWSVGSGAVGFLLGVARYMFFCFSADGIGDREMLPECVLCWSRGLY